MADKKSVQVLTGEQLSLSVLPLSGSMIASGGKIDTTCLVNSEQGEQLAYKVFNVDGDGTPLTDKIIIKDSVIPTASASNVGAVYMYVGDTNATYTHGYIYENQYTPTYEGSVTFDPANISVTDANYSAFLNAGTQYIADPSSVTHGTMTYHANSAIWRMVCLNADNEQVGVRQLYQSDYEDAGFVFTGTFEDGDVVNFTTTISESSSSYQWKRIDVQPGGGSVKFVPSLPSEGEPQYIYGVLLPETTREGYGIIQLFMWYNDQWYAAGAYDVDINPNGIVYEQSFDSSTNTWTVTAS